MLSWLKIAFGNIIKNRRRSLVTIFAVALGFASVSLFQGYIHNTYTGLRNSAIRGEGLGHLTIYKKGWQLRGKIEPDTHMFSKEEIGKIVDLVENEDDVILATPQLQISGLVSNGRVSTIFIAKGVVPEDERIIKGAWAAFRPITGKPLTAAKEYGVEMAVDLAAILNLQPGNDGVVMATTPDGQMNALDLQVSGIFDSGVEATNDKYMRVPFVFAQSLYDTTKADRIVVLLDDWQKTENARIIIQHILDGAGIACEIRTWNELSSFYSKVRAMFDLIFLFIFSIVFVVVTMSVINTMGMAVLERTREIGTLRAIGVKRSGISWLFAMEGGMLGLLGTLCGVVLNCIVWMGIRFAELSYIPPGNSSSVPLIVDLLPRAMVGLAVFLIVLSLFAAILPARRAAKLTVVEALAHV
jgi:putative ABC transport system permease protein